MDRQATRLPDPTPLPVELGGCGMNSIFYIIGVVVVVLAILSLLGLG
jgi:hypothetical protein